MKSVWKYSAATAAAVLMSFAATKTGQVESVTINGKTISIKYSSPAVNGREGKLFGKDGRIASDPNYPVWRGGANEATALHTDADLDIGGLAVPKGDYTLYVNLANPNQWELIVNKQTGQWGLEYNAKSDVGRVKMTMSKPSSMVEQLKYTLSHRDGSGNKATLQLAWEDHVGSVPITVK